MLYDLWFLSAVFPACIATHRNICLNMKNEHLLCSYVVNKYHFNVSLCICSDRFILYHCYGLRIMVLSKGLSTVYVYHAFFFFSLFFLNVQPTNLVMLFCICSSHSSIKSHFVNTESPSVRSHFVKT